jgi:hypothetical protein
MMGSREAVFLVNFVNLVNFVRTSISLTFSLLEREVSHKVRKGHNVHKVADDGTS